MKNSIVLALMVLSHYAQAYYTTGESGELVKPGQYHVGLEPQMRLSEGPGFNFSGFVDAPFGTDGSVRASVGFGETDFAGGLSYKWMPVPDYGRQPAIGGKIEAVYARRGGLNYNSLRLHPIVSKNFDTAWGLFTPYGSVPLSLISSATTNDTAVQLVVGTEYHHPDYDKWMFGGEIGVNFNKAFTYLSATVTYLLEEAEVTERRLKK